MLALHQHGTQAGLTNDNLTALFHVHQMRESGLGQLLRINWARIPSLIPDYAIAATADQLGRSVRDKMTISCLLQAGLGISSVVLLLRAGLRKHSGAWLLLLLACYGIPLLLSPGFQQLAMLATLPVNHGGNWITTAVFLALVVQAPACGLRSHTGVLVAVASLAFLATFSNRLFLLTAVLPPLLIHFAPARHLRYRLRIPSLGSLTGWSLAGGLVGCLLYLIVPHQCSDHLVGTRNLEALAAVLGAHRAAILFLLTPCLIWIGHRVSLGRGRWPPDGEQARGLLLGDSLLLMLCGFTLIYPWLARGEVDAIYLRYLLTPMLLAPCLAALAIQLTWQHTGPGRAGWRKPASVGVMLGGLALAGNGFAGAQQISPRAENPADRALLQALPSLMRLSCDGPDCVILTSNPPFHSLRLQLELAERGLRVLEVSGHGDPLVFWMGRSDFYKNQVFVPEDPFRRLRSSRLLATSLEQSRSLRASLGNPIQTIRLDDAGHVVLLYPDERRIREKAAVFFASQRQLPFCVPDSIRQPLLRWRSLVRQVMILSPQGS
ncbi:MAG: hypothetical protein VKO44_02795 [Cyanobacteriota bacterium]|nr:hypothetical protein [Cyanobacteriota bacterium]